MEKSKEILKQAGIIPDLSLAVKKDGGGVESTGPHTVKTIEDKLVKGDDYDTGKEILYVRYIFEEAGEKRKYDVPLKDKYGEVHYLVQKLADVPEGEEIILECKKNRMKNYIDVKRLGKPENINITSEDHIPLIEKEENTGAAGEVII